MTGRLASQSRCPGEAEALRPPIEEADPAESMPINRVHLLAIAVIAVLLVLPVSSGSAAGLQDCGGGVRAAKVSCSKAKRIAAEYTKTHARSLQGYTCSAGGSQGRCVLDRKVVTFPL
jgi:hypothetical protein